MNRIERHRTSRETNSVRQEAHENAGTGSDLVTSLAPVIDEWLARNWAATEAALTAAFAECTRRGIQHAFEFWRHTISHISPSPALLARAGSIGRKRAENSRDGFRSHLLKEMQRLASHMRGKGTDTPEILKQIRQLLASPNDVLYYRGRFISLNEKECFEIGKALGNEALGATEKRWRTKDDDRVDAICRANARVHFIPIDASFPSGHRLPPAHPGCRCWIQYAGVSHRSAYWESQS